MRTNHSTRLFGAVALLLACGAIGLAGCPQSGSVVSCQSVMGQVYAGGQTVANGDGSPLTEDDALALCEDLQAAPDCVDEFDRWLGCIQAADPTDASPLCLRETRSAVACRDDFGYEYHCDDALDDDGDNLVDCADDDCDDSPWCALTGDRVPQGLELAVDVLFVVDFHTSMAAERTALGDALSYLLDRLRDDEGALPDLHLGFAVANTGALGHPVPGCSDPPPDSLGVLHAGGCTGMGGANYLVDVAPRDCSVTRDPTFGRCTSHDCQPANCDHVSQANLVEDENDCPRCRNFGLLPEDLYDCVVGLPTTDCPFRQPLTVARVALDDNPGNPGFRRERAHLALVVVSNTDDCSAADAALYDPNPTPLGPPTAFRCFEHGVTCDQSGSAPGARTGCEAAPDGGGLLQPVSHYTDFFDSLAHPAQMTVAVASGPIDGSSAEVTQDASGAPALASSCAPTMEAATPAFRLRAFSAHFNDLDAAFWPYSPICGELGAALQGVGETVAAALAPYCLAAQLAGCSDPGAEVGQPADNETCNDDCQPSCWVVEARDHGLDTEAHAWLPRCAQVCAEGLCLDNTDLSAAYAGGRPELRDPDLPVAACWQVAYNADCTGSRGATVVVSRQEDPPLRTFVYVDCALLPDTESNCADGRDDDGDCLVDGDDPDCGG